MSKLAKAYAQARQSKVFECPHTGLTLTMRKPSYRTRIAAEHAAAEQWGNRDPTTGIDVTERANLIRALLIGFSLYEDGQDDPIGIDILELGEDVIESYHAVLDSIESPPVEEWTEQEYQDLMDLVKKSDPQIAAQLNVSEGSRLYGLLRYMANRPSS